MIFPASARGRYSGRRLGSLGVARPPACSTGCEASPALAQRIRFRPEVTLLACLRPGRGGCVAAGDEVSELALLEQHVVGSEPV